LVYIIVVFVIVLEIKTVSRFDLRIINRGRFLKIMSSAVILSYSKFH